MNVWARSTALIAVLLASPMGAQQLIDGLVVSESCKRNVFSCSSYESVIRDYQIAKEAELSRIAEGAEIERFCDVAADKIRVCDPLRNWRPISTEFQVDRQYANEDGFSAQIASSDGGSYHGLSSDAAAAAVIKMAQRNPVITGFNLLSAEAGGTEALQKQVLIYSGVVEGIPIAYINSIIVGRTKNVQIITFEIGTKPSDKGRAVHSDFASTIRLAEDF